MSASGDMDIEPEVHMEPVVDQAPSTNGVAALPDELYQLNGQDIPAFDSMS